MLDNVPAELRNRIYFLTESLVPCTFHSSATLYVDNGGASIAHTHIHDGKIVFRTGSGSLPQPAITRVCRKIRAESLKIYYGNNEFHIQRHFGANSDAIACVAVKKFLAAIRVHAAVPKQVHFDAAFNELVVATAIEEFGHTVVSKDGRGMITVSSSKGKVQWPGSGSGSGAYGQQTGTADWSDSDEDDSEDDVDHSEDDMDQDAADQDHGTIWDLDDDSQLLYFPEDNEESEDEDGDIMLYRPQGSRAAAARREMEEDDVFN